RPSSTTPGPTKPQCSGCTNGAGAGAASCSVATTNTGEPGAARNVGVIVPPSCSRDSGIVAPSSVAGSATPTTPLPVPAPGVHPVRSKVSVEAASTTAVASGNGALTTVTSTRLTTLAFALSADMATPKGAQVAAAPAALPPHETRVLARCTRELTAA